jgi:hypothetical protein
MLEKVTRFGPVKVVSSLSITRSSHSTYFVGVYANVAVKLDIGKLLCDPWG